MYSFGTKHVGFHDRLANFVDHARVGQVRRIIDQHRFAAGREDFINDARRRGDDIHVVFAPEPFLDDLHVQQAEKTAAESETQRDGAFRLINESRIVQPQFSNRRFQVLEVAGVDRVNPAENHRMDFLEAGQRFLGRIAQIGHGVADLDIRRALDVRDEITDVAGLQPLLREHLRREDPDLLYLVARVVVNQLDSLARLDLAGKNPDVSNDAAIDIEDTIENEAAQDFVGRFRGRRDSVDDRLENLFDADSHFRAGVDRFLGGNGQDFLELLVHRRECRRSANRSC